MSAKYYIYRNLHTGGFSVRFRGKVIDRAFTLEAEDVTFKVNETGRQRVIRDKQKNVHAFIVADKYTARHYYPSSSSEPDSLGRITYNPYKDANFLCNGKAIRAAKKIATQNGRCFLLE